MCVNIISNPYIKNGSRVFLAFLAYFLCIMSNFRRQNLTPYCLQLCTSCIISVRAKLKDRIGLHKLSAAFSNKFLNGAYVNAYLINIVVFVIFVLAQTISETTTCYRLILCIKYLLFTNIDVKNQYFWHQKSK